MKATNIKWDVTDGAEEMTEEDFICHINTTKYEQAKTHNLSKLMIGTEIIWTRSDGTTVELVKHAPAYQFKRPFWFNAADWSYVPIKKIQNWEIKTE